MIIDEIYDLLTANKPDEIKKISLGYHPATLNTVKILNIQYKDKTVMSAIERDGKPVVELCITAIRKKNTRKQQDGYFDWQSVTCIKLNKEETEQKAAKHTIKAMNDYLNHADDFYKKSKKINVGI